MSRRPSTDCPGAVGRRELRRDDGRRTRHVAATVLLVGCWCAIALPSSVATAQFEDTTRLQGRDGVQTSIPDDPAIDGSVDPPCPEIASGVVGPHGQEMVALREALVRYEGFSSAGGWGDHEVKDGLMWRAISPDVGVLRQRLAAEGFEVDGDAASSDTFDVGLGIAVMEYQRLHQLAATGRIDRSTRRSMNFSVERRLAQIMRAMMHLLEDDYADVPCGRQLIVNIPEFAAELWDGGNLTARYRVVVGTNDRDPGRSGLPNATPTMESAIGEVTLNPYWYVPPSIRDELRETYRRDRSWLDDNDFEFVTFSGESILRQTPGPGNALGLVKIAFPNRDAIYLHDTSAPEYFARTIRDSSHGCVRVDGAMDLATRLIAVDQALTMEETTRMFDAILATGEQEHIEMQTAVPIRIEYRVTRAAYSDGGDLEVFFNADIYGRDADDISSMERRIRRRGVDSELLRHDLARQD